MTQLLIVTNNPQAFKTFREAVHGLGWSARCVTFEEAEGMGAQASGFDAVCLCCAGAQAPALNEAYELLQGNPTLSPLPLLLVLSPAQLASVDPKWELADFLTWPAHREELQLRLERYARPGGSASNGSHEVRFRDLCIDLERYEVRLGRQRLEFTFKEFELLKFLAVNPGKVHSREYLLDRVWGFDYFGGTRTVDVHIRRIRSKLGPEAEGYIETLRNVGYRFVEEFNEGTD
ncbi:MAG: response regulator transcription factor [Candidatus Omnitrophica bacterium]|nr:response regulator transcription factor [Candidatus Omnitrophota bacterium]